MRPHSFPHPVITGCTVIKLYAVLVSWPSDGTATRRSCCTGLRRPSRLADCYSTDPVGLVFCGFVGGFDSASRVFRPQNE